MSGTTKRSNDMSKMHEQFATDSEREKTGVWLDYGDFMVKIARAGGSNKMYQKKLDRLTRQYRRAIATETLDPEVAEDLLRRAYASAVILYWKTKVDGEFQQGISDKDPEKPLLPVTKENVLATLRELHDLFLDIQSQAQSMALFRTALRDEASGN